MVITKEEVAAAGARLAIAHIVGNALHQMLQQLANKELSFNKMQRQSFRAQYLLVKALLQQAFAHIRDVPDSGDAQLTLGDAHQAAADLEDVLKLSGEVDNLLASCDLVEVENALTGVTAVWSSEDWAKVEAKVVDDIQQIRAKLEAMP